MSTKESILGTVKSARGMVSLTVLIIAFVLSLMVVDTRNKCVNTNDPNKFKSDTSLMYYIAILVIIACVVLLGYDIGSYLNFF